VQRTGAILVQILQFQLPLHCSLVVPSVLPAVLDQPGSIGSPTAKKSVKLLHFDMKDQELVSL
jgi:hypothetical protein